jgi:hypothetical protein
MYYERGNSFCFPVTLLRQRLFYSFLADIVVLLHLFFVLFAVLGGLLVLWKFSIAWFHVPAVLWAAGIEFLGWVCPLTPLENMLRNKGGAAGYELGFLEHYLMPVLYPVSLTRQVQIGLGLFVLCVNIGIYGFVWYRMRRA